ncbi:MAG: PadR family transcriptional regulator [Candidatus Omnitrophica bacterium]|jgi:DNA-binding PadR family transcriptional regulator|nr:PadR family transcriptional regulator [Candidatus Omnitrophota bacterium]
MIENEMILLGLLKESPKHGYEIKKAVKEILSLVAGIHFKSIYYPLMVLEKNGLISRRASKKGNRPLRVVYELTSKGHARFEQLLSQSFLRLQRPKFSLDTSLFFLQYLDPALAKRSLKVRMRILDRLQYDLKKMISSLGQDIPSSWAHILEHNLQMLQAESRFLSGLIQSLA